MNYNLSRHKVLTKVLTGIFNLIYNIFWEERERKVYHHPRIPWSVPTQDMRCCPFSCSGLLDHPPGLCFSVSWARLAPFYGSPQAMRSGCHFWPDQRLTKAQWGWCVEQRIVPRTQNSPCPPNTSNLAVLSQSIVPLVSYYLCYWNQKFVFVFFFFWRVCLHIWTSVKPLTWSLKI